MTDPVHCGQSQSRGVEVWHGKTCIGRATSPQDAYSLALAMLIGPQRLGGVLVSTERVRLRIAACAIEYIMDRGT